MTNENVSCFFSKNEKISKTKNFKFEMSSTVVRPAIRIKALLGTLTFFEDEKVMVCGMRSYHGNLGSFLSLKNLGLS